MKAISLYELNGMVRETVECTMDDSYWITAELSEVRVSAKGHCFIELVDKRDDSPTPLAKARGVIMSYLYPMIKMTFEEATDQPLRPGLKVQLEVEVSFNEVYGYSLVVKDIDPTYTMGSLARLRQEILNQLAKDGVTDMNKALTLPRPLQRIAVISSATAAGYEDFCNQLDNNTQGFRFTHKLFAATMQGADTPVSIISALDAIAEDMNQWDAVVIIRGGGAVSDLTGFDDYDLASCCAQFPLPIITGIGHERDTTVLDYVANTHLKTPTAVATFLIERMNDEAQCIRDAETRIIYKVRQSVQQSELRLANCISAFNNKVFNITRKRESWLAVTFERMCQQAKGIVKSQMLQLPQTDKLAALATRLIANRVKRLDEIEKAVGLCDPARVLKLGYSITRANGHVVTEPQDLPAGTKIVTTLAGGELHSVVAAPDTTDHRHKTK